MPIPDAGQMLVNISNNIPELIRLATAITYVLGTYFIVSSVIKMRNAPFISAVGQGQSSAGAHLFHIFIGAAMIFIVTFIHVGTATLFGEQAPFSYIPETGSQLTIVINAAELILNLIGFIACVKALCTIGYGQGENTMHGHISAAHKAAAYFVGGILCVNMVYFVSVIFTTFGIGGFSS